MMNHRPAPLRWSLYLLSLLALVPGCGPSDSPDGATTVESRRSAERVQEIIKDDDAPPEEEPWQLTTVGEVMEVMDAAVKVKTDENPEGIVLPVSQDLVVYQHGKDAALSNLKPGDRITLYSERQGNTEDGWQSLVVQIEGEPAAVPGTDRREVRASDAEDITSEGEAGNRFEQTFVGTITEISPTTITIQDPADRDMQPSTFPLDESVRVWQDGELGNLSELSPGGQVTLTGRSEGNRQDGYLPVVHSIEVRD